MSSITCKALLILRQPFTLPLNLIILIPILIVAIIFTLITLSSPLCMTGVVGGRSGHGHRAAFVPRVPGRLLLLWISVAQRLCARGGMWPRFDPKNTSYCFTRADINAEIRSQNIYFITAKRWSIRTTQPYLPLKIESVFVSPTALARIPGSPTNHRISTREGPKLWLRGGRSCVMQWIIWIWNDSGEHEARLFEYLRYIDDMHVVLAPRSYLINEYIGQLQWRFYSHTAFNVIVRS